MSRPRKPQRRPTRSTSQPAARPKPSRSKPAAKRATPATSATSPARPTARRPAAPPTAATRPTAARRPAPRADLGAPIDGFFARQPPAMRAILDELRGLIEQAAPDAESSIKWGMPFWTLDGTRLCALASHKAHINLILAGSPTAYADPDHLLAGEAKGGRHLKLRPGDAVPRDSVRGWLATAAHLARSR